MVKWTLTPRIGQRQWTDFEANAVLDELRIDVLKSKNQIRDRAGSDSDEDGDHGDYGDEEMGEVEEEEQGEGGNEDEGGVIAAIAAIAAELGLDVDETDNEAGGVPPFPDHETMENLNQDAGETKTSNQAKYKDDGEEEEEEEERGDEEEGGVIAAGAGVATKLGFDVDESKVREVSPFPDDETMENQNQNAEETETGNQAKDKDNSVDGGEGVVQVVQDPVAPQRSYTCGRCSEGIDLDSTFYRCVGHSCRGASTHQSWIFQINLFHDFSLRFFHLQTMRVHYERLGCQKRRSQVVALAPRPSKKPDQTRTQNSFYKSRAHRLQHRW